ncbi:unnamed protein product [Urochloa humidicola]
MGRPRRAVPDTSAPPAVFNIGDNTPSAVSNTGVDFLHQATTGCSNTMGGVGGSWTNMMMDEIDVDTIPLSVPLDDADCDVMRLLLPLFMRLDTGGFVRQLPWTMASKAS